MRRLGAVLAVLALVAGAPAAQAAGALSAEANAAYLANNAKQRGVNVRPSGLQYRIIHNGFGKRPALNDDCTVYYTGTLINGAMFDGTEEGLPLQFKPKDLIPGWTEALMLMREGDHWQLVIPANLAYGARGAGEGKVPPNQTLVFDLTLVSVSPAKEEPKKPEEGSPGNGAE